MALTERKEYGSIEVLASGHIQVREDTIIERDGEEISRTHHRHVIAPGDDYSQEDERVQAVCAAVQGV